MGQSDSYAHEHSGTHRYKYAGAHGNQYSGTDGYEYAGAHGNQYSGTDGNQHSGTDGYEYTVPDSDEHAEKHRDADAVPHGNQHVFSDAWSHAYGNRDLSGGCNVHDRAIANDHANRGTERVAHDFRRRWSGANADP